MKKRALLSLLMLFVISFLTGSLYSQSIQDEISGIDNSKPNVELRNAGRETASSIPAGGLLLIPESTNDRTMAFDPVTGDLIDANFIPPDATNLSTPIEAILSAGGQSILISDQVNDVVQEYGLDGTYIGVFAPAGGVNTAIMDNIRGIALRPNGNLLVTVGDGTNAGNVVEFDTDGNFLGVFFDGSTAGANNLFDIMIRPGIDYLISEIDADKIIRADLGGVYISDFAPVNNFPEQIFRTGSGNVLVADFGGTQQGVVEFTSAGGLVGQYSQLIGNRGVYELPNGNILTTNSDGVYEIDRLGNIIDTKINGVGARFISYVPGPDQEPNKIPLSPYIILLAVGLIALVTYFRYRR